MGIPMLFFSSSGERPLRYSLEVQAKASVLLKNKTILFKQVLSIIGFNSALCTSVHIL